MTENREMLIKLVLKAVGCDRLRSGEIADHLIANGVVISNSETTTQRWIPVTEMLPEESEYVLIWCGEVQVARIVKGISEEERSAMKRGELTDTEECCWTAADGYHQVKRSSLYSFGDVFGNNTVPYRWKANGVPKDWFGQDVTHWMPLPEPPKEEW